MILGSSGSLRLPSKTELYTNIRDTTYNLSNHYSDMAAQIPSSLSKVGLATDSFAKITAMAQQNQLNVLCSYLEAIDSIKWNQIGPAYSALDNVGFGEIDGEGIEDDAE